MSFPCDTKPDNSLVRQGGGRLVQPRSWGLVWEMNRLAILLLLFAMVIYSCAMCDRPCKSPAGLGAHMRSHRGESHHAPAVVLATQSKPPFDDYGRALWWKAHNAVCETCNLGGTVINCSYCNLVWHQTCAGLADVPTLYFMCPQCVLAEGDGQDMTTHGAGVDGMEGSDSDEDGAMDAGFESEDMFGEAAFIAHGVQRIPGLWEATNAEALRRAQSYDCEPMPTFLTEVDMMLLNISKAYGTPLSAMKEIDQVLQCVIQKMVDAVLLYFAMHENALVLVVPLNLLYRTVHLVRDPRTPTLFFLQNSRVYDKMNS